jgi:hypothetical protein
VSHARSRAAFSSGASDSRRASPCLREVARPPRAAWRRPLRRVRRALDASFRLIASSRRVIDASERFAAGSPARSAARLQQVSEWMVDASEQLGRAVRALRDTRDRAALAPGQAAEAPARLVESTLRWIDAAGTLAALSERLEVTFARLRDTVQRGGVVSGYAKTAADSRAQSAGGRPTKRPSRASGLVSIASIRRRRPAPASRAADAARRISRGRAPPLLSTCPL